MERHQHAGPRPEPPVHKERGHPDPEVAQEGSEVRPAGRRLALVAASSLLVGVLSTVPYNSILTDDPGSALFVGFVQHVFVISTALPKAGQFIYRRKIPMVYHCGCVAMGYMFTYLKSDAYSRIPIALGQLFMNTQMLVGAVVQAVLFGKRYTLPQLVGCALVTVGVAWATHASREATATDHETLETTAVLIGAAEMILAILALCLLASLCKLAFTHHGTHTDEQVCIQHFLSIPLFLFGEQWAKIGPRGVDWLVERRWWRWALLLCNTSLAYADRLLNAEFVGCAPNLLLVQLVQTLKKFIRVLIAVLISAPPFPAMGFWAGTGLLVIGSLKFLTASDIPDALSGKANHGSRE